MAELNYIKQLLNTGVGTEGSLLIVKKIYDTLIEEVDKALIPRSEAAVFVGPAGVPGSSLDIDLESPNSMAIRLIGEGAEITLDNNEYTSTNIKPLKYGVSIRITREMQEDSKWDLLAHNIKTAGKRFAQNETNLILTQLDSAANTVAGGAAILISNITRAMQYLDDSDYEGTSMLIGNEVLQDLRNIDTFVEFQKAGNTDMLKTGFLGIIYGLNVMKFSTNAAPSSTYSKYAYIYDRSEAFAGVEKRAITLENFELANFDMSGAAVTQRIAYKILRTAAVAKITTS